MAVIRGRGVNAVESIQDGGETQEKTEFAASNSLQINALLTPVCDAVPGNPLCFIERL
jgi:hypothetical protein